MVQGYRGGAASSRDSPCLEQAAAVTLGVPLVSTLSAVSSNIVRLRAVVAEDSAPFAAIIVVALCLVHVPFDTCVANILLAAPAGARVPHTLGIILAYMCK